MLQGDAWDVAPIPAADIRSRCAEVYTFCDLLVSQCMTDRPVEFRQMTCSVCVESRFQAVRAPQPQCTLICAHRHSNCTLLCGVAELAVHA